MNLSEQAISILRAGDCEVRADNLLAVAELVQAGYATVSDYYESIDVRITDTGRRAARDITAGVATDEEAQEAITEEHERTMREKYGS